MAKDEYIFAVARVKAVENEMLSKQDMDSLIAAQDLNSVVRFLIEKNIIENEGQLENFVEIQNKKLWDFISELTQDKKLFATLKVKNDFHNAKVAIKSAYIGKEDNSLYEKDGLIAYEKVQEAVKTKDFLDLPKFIAPHIEKAYEMIFKTDDPQLSDSILDKGQLEAMYGFAKESGNEVLVDYVKTQSTIADIKIAVRGALTKKDRTFFQYALSGISDFDVSQMSQIASQGQESLYSFLEDSGYSQTAELLKDDFTLFESWCDDKIIDDIQNQKYVFTTISPIIAYILARQSEIKNINIIIASKKNNVDGDEIRKMVTKTYV